VPALIVPDNARDSLPIRTATSRVLRPRSRIWPVTTARRAAGASVPTTGQGEGRSGRADRAALDPRAAAQSSSSPRSPRSTAPSGICCRTSIPERSSACPARALRAYEQLDRPAATSSLVLPSAREYRLSHRHEDHFYSVPQALVHQEGRGARHGPQRGNPAPRSACRRHARSFTRFAHTTLPEHLPGAHRAHLEWVPRPTDPLGRAARRACAEVIRPHLGVPTASRTRLSRLFGIAAPRATARGGAAGGGLRPRTVTRQRPLSNRRVDLEATHREFTVNEKPTGVPLNTRICAGRSITNDHKRKRYMIMQTDFDSTASAQISRAWPMPSRSK